MNPGFRVLVTSRFERELKRLAVQHPTLPALYRRAIGTLEFDPYNRSRQHAIKKLRVSTGSALDASDSGTTSKGRPCT
jgi:hypothetical protein